MGCFQPVITSTPPYSLVHQMSLIDLNLKKRKTTLGHSPVNARFSCRKLSPSTFLSLPCSQNQTLILKSFEIENDDTIMHNVPTSSDSLDSSPPVQYFKSISIIEHCHYNISFVRWLFSSGPLKSKEVSITDTYNLHSYDFPQLAQDESVILLIVNLSKLTQCCLKKLWKMTSNHSFKSHH